MQKHQFIVEKTSRYFTLGTLDEHTKVIWFVLHGYAQTADTFLKSLKDLQTENVFIVAPEGLSRFYWKDFIGNPVASWMTKTDRETDIEDNIKYLNSLFNNIANSTKLHQISIKVLGFSQGVATLSRWVFEDSFPIDEMYFYAGELAKELKFSESANYRNASLYYLYGNQDFFIKDNFVLKLQEDFENQKLNLTTFTFNGKHQIHKDALNFIKQTK